MRYVVLTSIIIVTLFCLEALAEEKKVVAGTNTALSRFFDPIPKPELEIKGVQDNTRSEWRPVVAIPALKLIESTRENAQLDALVLTQVGGGVSYQKLEYDSRKLPLKRDRSKVELSGKIPARRFYEKVTVH